MRPVVLIHGLGATSRSWQRLTPLLEERGCEVVTVDLPSFRRIDEAADHVAGLGLSGAIVAGHSMGGVVATALAEQTPAAVERLVLVNTPPTYESRLTAHRGTERLVRMPVVGRLLWSAASEDRVRNGLRTAFAPDHEVPDVFVEDMRATSWSAFVAATTAIDSYLAERPLAARLGALPVPATIVFGEQDRRVDHGSLSGYDGVPGVEVVRIPDAGHTPIWEMPERVAEAIGAG